MKIANWKSSDGSTYSIDRTGKTVASGGAGVQWSCSCPTNKKGTLCGHLRSLFMRTYKASKVTLTADGKKFIKAPMGAKARGKYFAKKVAVMHAARKAKKVLARGKSRKARRASKAA